MVEILHKLGLPVNLSIQGVGIDEINGIVHWLMLILFVGWGNSSYTSADQGYIHTLGSQPGPVLFSFFGGGSLIPGPPTMRTPVLALIPPRLFSVGRRLHASECVRV